MLPVNYDFELWTNSDFVEEVRITSSENGPGVNLTGYTGLMHWKISASDATPLQTFEINFIEPLDGIMLIRFEKEVIDTAFDAVKTSENFVGDRIVLKHDIVFTTPDETTSSVWFVGDIIINKGITNG